MDRKSNCTPFLLCLVVILTLLFSPFYPSPCLAKKVTLGWDPNPEPDLEGYVVYRNVGSPGPPYKYADTLPEDDLADPLNPKVTMTGLKKKKEYYIAVTAYDSKGNESYFSDDVCVKIADSVIENCSASLSDGSSSDSSSSGGGSSGGCFISSASLKTSTSIIEPLFISQPRETFFAVLFLLLIAAARSILSKQLSIKE